MAFEPGNQAAKGRTNPREFADMLRLAVKDAHGDKPKLRLLAEALVAKGMGGDVPALKEIADRLDGKVPQGVAHSGDGEGSPMEMIHTIELIPGEWQNTD
jgi:hypothetical protein